VSPRIFQSQTLPQPLAEQVLTSLEREHHQEPFSAVDPRVVVHRVARVVAELGVETTVYRGGLDLRGVEIDHLWLAATHPDPWALVSRPSTPFVVDVAFPLFVDHFVEVLRRFVAGDATAAELDHAAAGAGVRQRVVGLFPAPVRYLGVPVWSARG
jgi:hypothetical protein